MTEPVCTTKIDSEQFSSSGVEEIALKQCTIEIEKYICCPARGSVFFVFLFVLMRRSLRRHTRFLCLSGHSLLRERDEGVNLSIPFAIW
jgi:hypothetical protein